MMSKETITFTFPGVMKVGFGNRSLIIDGQYTTDNELEIIRLRELNFAEKQLVEKEDEAPKEIEVITPVKIIKATAEVKPVSKKRAKKVKDD